MSIGDKGVRDIDRLWSDIYYWIPRSSCVSLEALFARFAKDPYTKGDVIDIVDTLKRSHLVWELNPGEYTTSLDTQGPLK